MFYVPNGFVDTRTGEVFYDEVNTWDWFQLFDASTYDGSCSPECNVDYCPPAFFDTIKQYCQHLLDVASQNCAWIGESSKPGFSVVPPCNLSDPVHK